MADTGRLLGCLGFRLIVEPLYGKDSRLLAGLRSERHKQPKKPPGRAAQNCQPEEQSPALTVSFDVAPTDEEHDGPNHGCEAQPRQRNGHESIVPRDPE